MERIQADAVLVGAGIMGATLATLLQQLEPGLTVLIVERLGRVAGESSAALNNAGTGHGANCELNYTPMDGRGRLDLRKALAINGAYEQSLQFWAALVEQGALPGPGGAFLHQAPHYSLVWGEEDVAALAQRQQAMAALPQFAGMAFSRDHDALRDWLPLVMEGRPAGEVMAATRYGRGTDVDFGALTESLVNWLQRQPGVELRLNHVVRRLGRRSDGRWRLDVDHDGRRMQVDSPFVFLGAGGGALLLLQRAGLPEARGYGGFPVSGQWLICKTAPLVGRHWGKVYGKAPVGAPPMSMPHLDSRWINGRRGLLFGPYAGFSSKFLKNGSLWDLPASVRSHNLLSMVGVGLRERHLVGYLLQQLRQDHGQRLASLRRFFPQAQPEDWRLAVAGQRVQIIKREPGHRAQLKLGTEVVAAADGSLAALLGASPGASTAVTIMADLLRRCFPQRFQGGHWSQRLARLLPYDPTAAPASTADLARWRQRCDAILGLTEA
ncbi:MAG: malate dehydrogenase (quinone) [Cyanobacteria bacterium MAG CAR1_bin_15]|nr:malate dehydrogenase (quinone) [Cyanobacteria bacterium MAG CAR1_bin_15]